MSTSERSFQDDLAMPDDERMDRAELRVMMGFLGLRVQDLAAVLQVSERTVRYWLVGRNLIPDGVRLEVEAIEAETANVIGALVESYGAAIAPTGEPTMLTFATDHALWVAQPGVKPLPATWWDQVAARVALEVDGLVIRDSTP